MKKILVPIDFSPASKTASDYAASLAIQFNALVYLLHVYLEPVAGAEMPAAWTIAGTELSLQKRKKLNAEILYLQEKYGVEVDGDVILGFTSDTIIDAAKDLQADLIVVGMKKDSNKTFGSTVTATMRKATAPVLVVPEGFVFKRIKNIAYATDFDMMISSALFHPLLKSLTGSTQCFISSISKKIRDF
jgi:nucleotide-binding universal stress UspA family protein